MYECSVCGAILEPHECIISHSAELCEVYSICPHCHGECGDFEEERYDE